MRAAQSHRHMDATGRSAGCPAAGDGRLRVWRAASVPTGVGGVEFSSVFGASSEGNSLRRAARRSSRRFPERRIARRYWNLRTAVSRASSPSPNNVTSQGVSGENAIHGANAAQTSASSLGPAFVIGSVIGSRLEKPSPDSSQAMS